MTALSIAIALSLAAPPEREDFRLENGIRATVIRIDGAPREALFTLLPLGLALDDARRAQHSHLLEHLVIRTTDPEGLSAPGLLFNGETQGTTLRLETLAEPARWREALARHERWLAARSFDAAILEREKTSALSEVETTVPRGFTHKWALAAWGQVARHGEAHAAVRGDVLRATVGDMEAYAKRHVGPGPGVRFVAVGPVAAGEIRAALESGIGKIAALPALEKTSPSGGARATAAGDRTATWDLAARHYLEWYQLPDGGPEDRVAALLFATAIGMDPAIASAAKERGGVAFASADLVTPEGRHLAVSSSLAKDADPSRLRAAVRAAIGSILDPPPGLPDVETRLRMLRTEFSGFPDFDALRKARGSAPGAEFLEANLVLGLVAVEESTGLQGAEIERALERLTPERVAAIAKSALAESERRSLVLEPSPSGTGR